MRFQSFIPLVTLLTYSLLAGWSPALAENESIIAAAIESDLKDSERVSPSDLGVKEDDGLITLSGRVDSLLDKRYASEIAKRTKGVRAVSNQILVRRSDRSDDAIQEDVEKVMVINDSIERPEITIAVSNGGVDLVGQVDSLAEKRVAGLAAAGVHGVLEVNNQLVVRPNQRRSNADLRADISALFVHSVYLDDVDLNVDIEKGVAKLSGSVHSLAQKQHAMRLAEVMGVLRVDAENITIDTEALPANERAKRYGEISDTGIKDAFERLVRNDPFLSNRIQQIDAAVTNGRVTLTGTVNRLQYAQRAARLAQDIVGVRRVVNQLTVDYEYEPLTDDGIRQETERALARSAYLDNQDLIVHVQQAHVSLFGIVDRPLEKEVAQWIASGVPGVVHVNNSLAVEREWTEKSDESIKSDLLRKLKYGLFLTEDDLSVTVQDGVAIIRGQVDTWRQWQAVNEFALEAGARHPHNLIDIRSQPRSQDPLIYVPE